MSLKHFARRKPPASPEHAARRKHNSLQMRRRSGQKPPSPKHAARRKHPASPKKPAEHAEAAEQAEATDRRGFTLLETVFALAISLLLFGALTMAMDLYRRLSTSGREDVSAARLKRAVLRMIETDIRGCVFRSPEETQTASEDTSASAVDDELTVSVDPAEAYANASAGIVGDATTLVIHSVRPTRDVHMLLEPAAQEQSIPPNEQRSISYFLAVSGASGLPGVAADFLQVTEGEVTEGSDIAASGEQSASARGTGTTGSSGSISTGVIGLARLDGDRLAMQFADSAADVETLGAGSQLLASEVNSLTFRYFDGLQWYDAWDSSQAGTLPNAIEITLGFQSPDIDGTFGETPSDPIRHVISIPTAEPAVLASEP